MTLPPTARKSTEMSWELLQQYEDAYKIWLNETVDGDSRDGMGPLRRGPFVIMPPILVYT